jgi:hypothetical protein
VAASEYEIGAFREVSSVVEGAVIVAKAEVDIRNLSSVPLIAPKLRLTSNNPRIELMRDQSYLPTIEPQARRTTLLTFEYRRPTSISAVGRNQFTYSLETLSAARNLVFLDNGVFPDRAAGDGDAVVQFQPMHAGRCALRVVSNGTLGGEAFRRSAKVEFDVSLRSGVIESASGLAVDANQDGVSEDLGMRVVVRVTEAGLYRIVGQLERGEQRVGITIDASLTPGTHTLTGLADRTSLGVAFRAVATTLALTDVVLSDFTNGELVALDEMSATGTTVPIQPQAFELTPVQFGDQSTINPLSLTPGNGFDTLRYRVDVKLRQASVRGLRAELKRGQSTVTVASVEDVAIAGRQFVNLDFSGAAIRKAGLDGPYRLDLTTSCESGESRESPLRVTGPLAAADFREGVATYAIRYYREPESIRVRRGQPAVAFTFLTESSERLREGVTYELVAGNGLTATIETPMAEMPTILTLRLSAPNSASAGVVEMTVRARREGMVLASRAFAVTLE